MRVGAPGALRHRSQARALSLNLDRNVFKWLSLKARRESLPPLVLGCQLPMTHRLSLHNAVQDYSKSFRTMKR